MIIRGIPLDFAIVTNCSASGKRISSVISQIYLGTRFVVIDSAHPTANALKELLTREQMLHSEGKATRVFFTSDDPSRSLKIAEEFLGGDVELHQMTIEGRR